MVHTLLQVDCTEMCVGSACTQPSYNDKNPSSVFFKSPYMCSRLKSSRLIVWSHDRAVIIVRHCWRRSGFDITY